MRLSSGLCMACARTVHALTQCMHDTCMARSARWRSGPGTESRRGRTRLNRCLIDGHHRPYSHRPCSHRSLQSRPAVASAPARCALRVALGVDVSAGDVDRLIGQIDNDGNGVLNFDEFMGICQDKTA